VFCAECGSQVADVVYCPNCGNHVAARETATGLSRASHAARRALGPATLAGLAGGVVVAIVLGALLLVLDSTPASRMGADSGVSPPTGKPSTLESALSASASASATRPPEQSLPPTTAAAAGRRNVRAMPAGLFCRDLKAEGFGYTAAVTYWRVHGQPDRMDADLNGIPCETVYPAPNISAYWGRAMPDTATEAPEPRGTLLVLGGPEGGFGQSFPEGRCAVWQVGFVNQSNTGIDQITFAPPSGSYSYTDYSADKPDIESAPPEPAVLDIYLAPGEDTAIEFKTCTSTPPPKNWRYEYGATPPDTVPFRWETGHTGTTTYR
jgi:hypothetical protein